MEGSFIQNVTIYGMKPSFRRISKMTKSQRLAIEQSEKRERLNALNAKEDLSPEERGELDPLRIRLQEIEPEMRAALVVEGDEIDSAKAGAGATGPDAETRERVELRSKASLTNFLLAAARGRLVDGAEAELCAAAGVSGIPLELWDVPRARAEPEQRAVTGSPGTVGVNLDPIRPFVFANSIAPRLGIEMPRVASGTFASATISTSTTADAKVKSAESPATAGAFSVTTATPKRVSARLELTLEDIAAVGQENFESILRQNLALALSDELDDQAINGDGAAPNLTGIIKRLETIANPVDPTAVPTFDTFVAAFADSIDGLWSSTMKEIAIVAGVDTFKLSAKAFRDIAAADLGSISFADYAMMHTGGWWTNKGMPAAAATIQRAIVYRSGRTMAGGGMGMRTAVCPVWGEVAIDDVYSGSSKAERYFTFHVLLGDVILVQPDAYTLREFKVSA